MGSFNENDLKQTTESAEAETPLQFMCNLCGKLFYNSTALANHKKLNHDGNSSNMQKSKWTDMDYKSCDFKFIPLEKSETDITSVKDGLVTRTFSEDTSYLIVRIDCEDDDTDAAKKRRLEGVVKRAQMKPVPVNLRGPFTCNLPSLLRPDLHCLQIFFNCCDYSMHYRDEHTKRRKAALRCQVCEKPLDTIEYHPANQLMFYCRPCRQSFADSAQFEDHNKSFHMKMKPYQCSVCWKHFAQQSSLHQHFRMHTGIRPFPCTFCAKSFTQKAGLDQHLRTHTKIKPFKCVICGKCFSQSVHLKQHMRTHTNIQPFECSVCRKKFKQSSHLNFHMRSHLGVELYENYPQMLSQENDMGYSHIDLANAQQMGDANALYYASEMGSDTIGQNTYDYN